MCLLTTQPKPKIAKEDITVYKIFGQTYYEQNIICAAYQNFIYEFNKLYETEFTESTESRPKLHDDIAWEMAATVTYNFGLQKPLPIERPMALHTIVNTYPHKFKIISCGFHAIIDPERAEKLATNVSAMYVCTIPKGAEYYTDETGLIVANKIIVTEELYKV